ncbi:Hypothetical_protein [Hexamita inflata]|uniref:Hypothetical_protein n=1 Tax=Hexamita inflata TaxID=28002 RepID=A0AA86THX6_9EUKA|nr:Hypothetical protein HINF_LOCUS5401 [Hexamita inflata]
MLLSKTEQFQTELNKQDDQFPTLNTVGAKFRLFTVIVAELDINETRETQKQLWYIPDTWQLVIFIEVYIVLINVMLPFYSEKDRLISKFKIFALLDCWDIIFNCPLLTVIQLLILDSIFTYVMEITIFENIYPEVIVYVSNCNWMLLNVVQLQNNGYIVEYTLLATSINALEITVAILNTYPLLKLVELVMELVTVEILNDVVNINQLHSNPKSDIFITQLVQHELLIID